MHSMKLCLILMATMCTSMSLNRHVSQPESDWRAETRDEHLRVQGLEAFTRVPAVDAECATEATRAVSVTDDGGGRVTVAVTTRQLPDRAHLSRPQGLPFEVGKEFISAGRWQVLETSSGWLVGLHHGEFGGGLWAFSGDGQHRRRLSDNAIVAVLQRGPRILVVERTGYDSGVVRVLNPLGDAWDVDTPIKLSGAPLQATMQETNLLVLTTRVAVVIADGVVLMSLDVPEVSDGARPFSLALAENGPLYVGMALYLLVLAQNDTVAMYVPLECAPRSSGMKQSPSSQGACGC